MEKEFDRQFSHFQSNQKRSLILSSEKYAEIVTVLQQLQNEDFKPSKKTQKLVVRFSLQYELNQEVLYNHGVKGDLDKPKKVVKTEELFGLLTTIHQRLGHAGRDIMWQGLRDYQIWHHRNGAALQQQKQAENMLEKSKNRFGAVEVGQTVRLPIDAVDRPKIGHSTLFGVVMEENQGFYQIGTTNGILQQKLTRNQFEPANNNFLSFEEVPQVESTFRAAVGSQSLTGTEGHKHCNCTNGCVNGRCACRKANLQCNSRCHKSNTCKNK